MRGILTFFAILIAVFLLMIYIVPEITSTPQKNIIYGINDSGISPQEIPYLYNSNLTWVRSDVGSYEWNTNIMLQQTYHFHILAILDYNMMSSNFTLQEWTYQVEFEVRQYASSVQAWEIWNEPFAPNFQKGFENGSPYHYFLMLQSAYKIIKKYDPSSIVVGVGGINSLQELSWLSSLISYGGLNYMDALSLHIYDTPRTLVGSVKDMAPNMPLWVTETGFNGNATQKSAFIQIIYPELVSLGVSAIFYYELNSDYTGNFGLFENSVPTQAWYTLQNQVS